MWFRFGIVWIGNLEINENAEAIFSLFEFVTLEQNHFVKKEVGQSDGMIRKPFAASSVWNYERSSVSSNDVQFIHRSFREANALSFLFFSFDEASNSIVSQNDSPIFGRRPLSNYDTDHSVLFRCNFYDNAASTE